MSARPVEHFVLKIELRFEQMLARANEVAEFQVRFVRPIVRRPCRQAAAVRIAGPDEIDPVRADLIRQPSIEIGPN